MNKSFHQYFLSLCLSVSLVACNSSDSENIVPTINGYQKDITFTAEGNSREDWQKFHNTTIRADVSDDGGIAHYQWDILSAQNLDFQGLDGPEFSFSYPTGLTEESNILVFDLTVIDNKGATSFKTFEYDLNDFVEATFFSLFVKPNQLVTLTPEITGKKSKIASYQ